MSDLEEPLPPSLELLWGRRRRGRRGPRPGLSVDAIVTAAIEVADAEGLQAVSMARVARQLGFTPMSLYRHINGKDELLALMWNGSAVGADQLVLQGEGWRERLRAWAEIQREMLDRHSWLTQMPMAAPPLAPNSLTFVERGLETLEGTGLQDRDKIRVIGVISSYTLNEARMAHDAARAAAEQPSAAGPPPSFERMLRRLLDPGRYPLLHRLAWAEGGGAPPVEAEEFALGLELILDGVQALIDRASSDGGG